MTSKPTICVPIRVRRLEEVSDAISRTEEVADIIELRLDYLEGLTLKSLAQTIPHFVGQTERPVILTLRPIDQGGQVAADNSERYRFWSSIAKLPSRCFIDLESELAQQFACDGAELPLDWTRIICSHHDFKGVPANLDQIYERMLSSPARILKIAVQATDVVECLPILRLLAQAQDRGREMIALVMGQAGIMTRVLGPARGAFLTYGSLNDESATAPGQIRATDLREIFRLERISRETQVVGLIGKPVGNSFSPRVHNAALAAAGLDAVYLTFETSDPVQFVRRMAHPRTRELDWNLRGLSVTAPHKLTVMSCLDAIDPAAAEIGAINTIVVKDQRLEGHNTDAYGFIIPLKRKLGSIANVRCALIGAGGAARAVLWSLRNEGAEVTVFARDVEKARPVATEFGAGISELKGQTFEGFEVVINATPLGSRGQHQDDTAATGAQLAGVRLAYDLVYNPTETRFLHEARVAGCETLSGIEMLIAQATQQFKLWTDREPDIEVMKGALSEVLK